MISYDDIAAVFSIDLKNNACIEIEFNVVGLLKK